MTPERDPSVYIPQLEAERGALQENVKSLEAQVDQAWAEVERLSLLIPTTAQVMVYQSLLDKYQASQAKVEELTRENAALKLHLDAAYVAAGHSQVSSEPLACAIERMATELAQSKRDSMVSHNHARENARERDELKANLVPYRLALEKARDALEIVRPFILLHSTGEANIHKADHAITAIDAVLDP